MNENLSQALIITGPTGSGKTALASYIGAKLKMRHIQEDEYWLSNGWRNERRTPEREQIVQQQVEDELQTASSKNGGVILDILISNTAPNNFTQYLQYLHKNSITYRVLVLQPSVESILPRIVQRGRPVDLSNLEEVQEDVRRQLLLLESDYILPEWRLDSSKMSVEEIYATLLKNIR